MGREMGYGSAQRGQSMLSTIALFILKLERWQVAIDV